MLNLELLHFKGFDKFNKTNGLVEYVISQQNKDSLLHQTLHDPAAREQLVLFYSLILYMYNISVNKGIIKTSALITCLSQEGIAHLISLLTMIC